MQLDYNLKTTEERIAFVEQLIAETPPRELNNRYLSYLSDYILFVYDKDQTKKEKKNADGGILTRNRQATINKRETSFEGLTATLENGEDGIYNLMLNDKNQLLDRKAKITQEDIDTIPHMREYYETIQHCEERLKKAKGRDKYTLKKQIIETWQSMYIMRSSYYGIPMQTGSTKNQIKSIAHMQIPENITLDENDWPISDSPISLLNPECVSILLCYYSQLKEESMDDFQSDMRFMLMDLENLTTEALEEKYPEFYDLVIWKIDGKTNDEIQELMKQKYDIEHNGTYYSKIWRNKIPQLIANEAKKQFLVWYFTNVECGEWKKCSKCGEIKLAHNMFFAKNSTKDGWYSQCKDCKNGRSK